MPAIRSHSAFADVEILGCGMQHPQTSLVRARLAHSLARNVQTGDFPAARRQPHGVPTLAHADVQRAARRHGARDFHQQRIGRRIEQMRFVRVNLVPPIRFGHVSIPATPD